MFYCYKDGWRRPDGWLVGGYNGDENAFYADFGLGGMVADAEDVTSWALMEDAEFIAK